MPSKVTKEILSYYESDSPATKANLYRFLESGALAGTGKLLILPVDQGFEHGPERSFAPNPLSYDPHYHFQMAIDAKLNGYEKIARRNLVHQVVWLRFFQKVLTLEV